MIAGGGGLATEGKWGVSDQSGVRGDSLNGKQIPVAEEVGDEGVCGLVVQLLGSPNL